MGSTQLVSEFIHKQNNNFKESPFSYQKTEDTQKDKNINWDNMFQMKQED